MRLIQVQAGGVKVQVKKKKGQYITLVHSDLKLPAGCDLPRSIWMQAGKVYIVPIPFVIHNTLVSHPLSQRPRKDQ